MAKKNFKDLTPKQQLQRLTQARAQALRAGQSTKKLDAKIEKLRMWTGSTISPPTTPKPSPGKYVGYKEAGYRPVQGGAVTPK